MPKILNMEQGSTEWLGVRLGIPTASMFHKIMTPKTMKFSTQARGYAFQLIAEKLLNESGTSLDSLEWIARGKELEPQAVKMFEFEQEIKTEPVGFIVTDDGRMGATPDRLIAGHAAALEIKCPKPSTHIEYLIDGFGADYMPQVQGQAFIGEFEWVARYSFHPAMPPMLVKTYRDEPYIAALRDAVDQFCDMKDELLEKVKALGFFAERAQPMDALDELFEDLAREQP